MATSDFSRNLRLLCGYGRSVSDICRRAGINRHQFERYLAGRATPSLHTLRRICDFFGLEDHEILLDHRAFGELVRIRPPRLERTRDRIAEFMDALAGDLDLAAARRYVGFYHAYFQPDRTIPELQRCLVRVTLADRCLVSTTVERYPKGRAGLPSTVKYRGILLPVGNKLIMLERQINDSESVFVTILDGTGYNELTYLSGIVTGISPDVPRTTYSLRTVWHYLGAEVGIRQRLAVCGQLPMESPEVSDYLRHCIENELAAGDPAFMPRT